MNVLRVMRAFVSSDETRYTLNGIHFVCRAGKRVELQAVDGRRLIVVTLDFETETDAMAIIPSVLIDSVLASFEDYRRISLEVADGRARFYSDDHDELQLSARVVDGVFPEIHEKVIPNPLPTTFAGADSLIVNAGFLADCAKALDELKPHHPGIRLVQGDPLGVVLFLATDVTIALMPIRIH